MPTITNLPFTGSPTSFEHAGVPIGRGAHADAAHSPELIPGNPTGTNRFSSRRTSSTAAQFAQTFERKRTSQSIDGNIQALLALSSTLAKEVPADVNRCRYLIGVKTTVNGKEHITLCSDRVLEEDPHAGRMAGLESRQVSQQDKKKILSDILESRQVHKNSAANLCLKKVIDTLDNKPGLAPDAILDIAREALLAVRLEDIATTYKPEEDSEAHRLIQDAWKTLEAEPDAFHDEDNVQQALADIVEAVNERGTELAEDGLKQLLRDVSKSPALPKESSAYGAIKKVITSEPHLSAHLDIQVFQKLVEQIKRDLPGQGEAAGSSFDLPLPARREVPSRESSMSQKSLLSMSLSREASLIDVPEEGGIPLPLQQCSNEFVKLYYGKVDELIKRCDPEASKEAASSGIVVVHDEHAAAMELAEMKEAIGTLIQYRSHELRTRFRDNPAGLIAHQMSLPKESGEYMATERALTEVARLLADGYRSEYRSRPEQLHAERKKLASSVTDSGSSGHAEAVDKAAVTLKLEAMDKVLTSLDEQRAERITQRSNSLYLEFLEPGSLENHKAKLLKNDPAFQGTEEYEAIEKAIEMLKSARSLD